VESYGLGLVTTLLHGLAGLYCMAHPDPPIAQQCDADPYREKTALSRFFRGGGKGGRLLMLILRAPLAGFRASPFTQGLAGFY
jgi:hypothetical protein